MASAKLVYIREDGKQVIQPLLEAMANGNQNLFHVNCNNHSNSHYSRYFLDNYDYCLNNNDQSNDGSGDCSYNNGNDNDSNNNGKINLESLLNCAIKIYNNPIYQRDLIRKDNNGKIGVYA
jgi:hypothetical protein